ncbi:hypothetical protein QE357_001232 [Siphonobacter sp. BAB-5404]|nr:hypothetical protein [Siphonobacter sp. SORGH_AS_1065]MDR6194180.1 hypothetical protein [Siphonobacter sp. SORGH_AS_0500]
MDRSLSTKTKSIWAVSLISEADRLMNLALGQNSGW